METEVILIKNNFSLVSKDIDLNFKQFIVLEQLKDVYDDINILIRKLIKLDNSIISLNREYFDYFDEKVIGFIHKNQYPNTLNSTLRIQIKFYYFNIKSPCPNFL